jgi:hypothetical protein
MVKCMEKHIGWWDRSVTYIRRDLALGQVQSNSQILLVKSDERGLVYACHLRVTFFQALRPPNLARAQDPR